MDDLTAFRLRWMRFCKRAWWGTVVLTALMWIVLVPIYGVTAAIACMAPTMTIPLTGVLIRISDTYLVKPSTSEPRSSHSS